jgi:sugar-specific transcriptional regulator TrmB
MLIETELKKAGLSDKEAAAFLAALSLGPSPVQVIARRAKIARATTYVVLEKLMELKLITKRTDNKRTLFVPAPPAKLLQIIERQQQIITQNAQEIERLIPKLQAIMNNENYRPVVQYFDGEDGLRTMRREMAMHTQQGDTWYNLTPVDYLRPIFGNDLVYYRQRAAKGITSKTIFTTRSEKARIELLKTAKQHRTERRFISPDLYTSPGGFTIYCDRVAIGSFKGRIGGIIIESPTIVSMMREMFAVMWQHLEKE